MKPYQIGLMISLAILAIGILLSIIFNTFFLFLVLPFGFAWGFSRRGKSVSSQEQSSSSFCQYCGTKLTTGNPFCPACGRPIQGRTNESDLR